MVTVVKDLTAIPHTLQTCSYSRENKIPLKRNKRPSEPEPGSVQLTICHDRLGAREDRAERCTRTEELI